MKNLKRTTIRNFLAPVFLSIVIMSILTIPLTNAIAPLGEILLPGNGLWRVPGEIQEKEFICEATLNNTITIYRDEWGIPHVYASTEKDASFAFGYLHAQDRMFQMDLMRRLVRGTLSEIIGEDALELDKFNLATGKLFWAQKTVENMIEKADNGEINYLESLIRYCDGVNYFIKTHLDELPIEYAILGFKPTRWTLLDIACLVKYMAEMLTWSYTDLYETIACYNLGSSNFLELFRSTYGQIPVCPNYGSFNLSFHLPFEQGAQIATKSIIDTITYFLSDVKKVESQNLIASVKNQEVIGSNNWVVDGSKTRSGRPILCNDMHLAWTLPGIWYEGHVVITSKSLNLYGFTLPGAPMVIVGHNERIAWGFTNTAYDVMDWYYYEKIDEDQYVYNNSIEQFKIRPYSIAVKNEEPVAFEVKETVHGPVLNEFLGIQEIPTNLNNANIILATKWIAHDVSTLIQAIYGFNHAKNRDDFNQASKYFDCPAQNIVYADINGNIAMRPTGKIPIRDGNGTFIYNGSAGEGEWMGFIDFEDLPQTENPAQGYLVSANQIVAGPEYSRYLLQNDYSTGYRSRRINELINATDDITLEKMKEIQLDVKSTPARALIPFLIDLIENIPSSHQTDVILDIYSLLIQWNYDMDKDLSQPSIYRVWREFYYSYTFDDEFDAFNSEIKPRLDVLERLTRENDSSIWFDDSTTSDRKENRSDIIYKALNASINFLIKYYGTKDVAAWKYGLLHRLEFLHIAPGLDALGKGPFEGDGEQYTVNPSYISINSLGLVSTARFGASERMIVDLNDLENSISVIPSGQRGIVSSRHYSDQLIDLFLHGNYHRQYFYTQPDAFPSNLIESGIIFMATSETSGILFVQSFIICSFCGICVAIFGWKIKKNRSLIRFKKKFEKKSDCVEKQNS
ncbi:MAG: penicillin acylase family protein [Candidatus Lokiarchaeota archaeon]|nr:penicillin acylase family protein [Candidatus Lokiarchaeota archaeon]